MAVAVSVGGVIAAGCTYSPYKPSAPAFSGDSSAARETTVVANLDTPAPKGKNVIWCGTFQLCWDQLKPLVGPIRVAGAEETVRRLDAGRMPADDLPPGGYYAAAGRVKDGIIETIRAQMAERFPNVSPALPEADGAEAVAYAYLHGAVKFRQPYFDYAGIPEFVNSAGQRAGVKCFSLSDNEYDDNLNGKLRRQIDILYCHVKDHYPEEFVLDLDKTSAPSQLILACVAPKETLAATWHDVQRKMDEWKPAQEERAFRDNDKLVVPEVNYKIKHSFKELEAGGGLKAWQDIDFRLDRSGAIVSSAAGMYAWGMSRNFSFTRPFLIALRKRGAAEPYFVMWIDNAELLCKENAR